MYGKTEINAAQNEHLTDSNQLHSLLPRWLRLAPLSGRLNTFVKAVNSVACSAGIEGAKGLQRPSNQFHYP